MSVGTKLYAHLPVPGQHVAVSAFGASWWWIRFGPGYRAYLGGFARRDRWSEQQWGTWQEARLRHVLTMAADHVPYYREGWSAEQRRAARGGRMTDLPILEKEPLRSDSRQFCRDDRRPVPQLTFHTSGSTGTPVATHWTVRELRASMALREARSAGWAGVSFRLPRATFSGRLVVPRGDAQAPFHRYNAVERQVYLSAFHLGPDTAPAYIDALRRHGTRWATGYAVSFSLLARYVVESGLDAPQLDAVITTSEKVTPPMREVIERAFRTQVHEEYSTVDNALFASECERGSLHVSPDVGLIEIIRADGSPCAPGEVGEVVATGLMRTYQPLIRHRVGDFAAWAPEGCGCGRAMPVLSEVVGRTEDVVVGPDGRELVRFHGIFTDQPHIREGQVIQETPTEYRVVVVPAPGFGDPDVADIVHRMRVRLGAAVVVRIDTVDAIPRTPAGKFQAVVSLLRGPAGG